MTDIELKIARTLGTCSFPPATAQKRFASEMAYHAENMPEKPISARQARYLCIMAWRYRRQLSADVIEAALDLGETCQPLVDAEVQAMVHKRAQLKRAKSTEQGVLFGKED